MNSPLKIKNDEINDVQKSWHRWVEHDYIYSIIGSSNINHPYIPENQLTEWYMARKEIQKSMKNLVQEDFPTPDNLENIFKQFGVYEKLEIYIKDYEYYILHKKHRDVERWKSRNNWLK